MSDHVQSARIGRIGHIRLDRPQALNSLTLPMVRRFAQALDAFGKDDDTLGVVVTGAGERAFCAGGDIRGLHDASAAAEHPYKAFWREEYRLDARIATFPKPYVVVMDGLVMGGGVGISAHGNRRLVTRRTRLAMPEVGIGYIPDVGGTWLLGRGGGAGFYMALSGCTVGPADALHLALADLCIDECRIPELLADFEHCLSPQDIDDALAGVATDPGEAVLTAQRMLLDDAMAGESIEDILAALKGARTEFSRRAVIAIARNSPTSLRLTLELLKRARESQRLEECLLREYAAACALLASHDLREGVRAAIIDKDRSPRWSPATLAEVDDATIAGMLDAPVVDGPSFAPWDQPKFATPWRSAERERG